MNIKIDPEKCKACGDCEQKCSSNVFRVLPFKVRRSDGTMGQRKLAISYPGNCIDCMACTETDFCPSNAVEVEK